MEFCEVEIGTDFEINEDSTVFMGLKEGGVEDVGGDGRVNVDKGKVLPEWLRNRLDARIGTSLNEWSSTFLNCLQCIQDWLDIPRLLKDDDLEGVPEDELLELINSEGAHVVGSMMQPPRHSVSCHSSAMSKLFDDDDNVEIVHHRKSKKSPEATKNGEEEGFVASENSSTEDDDGNSNLDEGEEEEEDDGDKVSDGKLETVEKPRQGKHSTCQDQHFAAKAIQVKDKPNVNKNAIDAKAKPTQKTTKCPWTVIRHGPNGRANLSNQHDLIIMVCHTTITAVELTLATVDAWPDGACRPEYHKELLLDTCEELKTEDLRTLDICDKILRPGSRSAMTAGNWVVNCLSRIHSDIPDKALKKITIFQLGVGEACIQQVEVLKHADIYIYPGQWGPDDKDPTKETWRYNPAKIYQNPAFIKLIQGAFFDTKTAFGYQYMRYFMSSLPNKTDKELSMALLALVATAV
ncbi:hypothetical protein NP233_g10472 [Leucocoprinus birnbaumii]|uniref:DUF6532 domain-containing protein n=1 Tax=Leucocoprinus birnbaumii TaxID=56174 RepID=A0AAD5VP82_9AGAR|nr:hypothetical protein NP233_g10472 [Leucocoprinus birnbaumii]